MARFRYSGIIRPEFFAQIDKWIEDNRHSARSVAQGMDAIAMLYAYTALAEAQKRSYGGKRDPGSNGMAHRGVTGIASRRVLGTRTGGNFVRGPGAPWSMPVPRVTGDYFHGWHVTRLARGQYILKNPTREAYFIEMGINHPSTGRVDSAGNSVRVRRPVLKLSVMKAIAFARGTGADKRIIDNILVGGHSLYGSQKIGLPRGGRALSGETY